MPVRPEVRRLNAWKKAHPWVGDRGCCAGCGGKLGESVFVAEGGGTVHAGSQLLSCLAEYGFKREEMSRDALALPWEHSRQDRKR
jgi:hypothetical protein